MAERDRDLRFLARELADKEWSGLEEEAKSEYLEILRRELALLDPQKAKEIRRLPAALVASAIGDAWKLAQDKNIQARRDFLKAIAGGMVPKDKGDLEAGILGAIAPGDPECAVFFLYQLDNRLRGKEKAGKRQSLRKSQRDLLARSLLGSGGAALSAIAGWTPAPDGSDKMFLMGAAPLLYEILFGEKLPKDINRNVTLLYEWLEWLHIVGQLAACQAALPGMLEKACASWPEEYRNKVQELAGCFPAVSEAAQGAPNSAERPAEAATKAAIQSRQEESTEDVAKNAHSSRHRPNSAGNSQDRDSRSRNIVTFEALAARMDERDKKLGEAIARLSKEVAENRNAINQCVARLREASRSEDLAEENRQLSERNERLEQNLERQQKRLEEMRARVQVGDEERNRLLNELRESASARADMEADAERLRADIVVLKGDLDQERSQKRAELERLGERLDSAGELARKDLLEKISAALNTEYQNSLHLDASNNIARIMTNNIFLELKNLGARFEGHEGS